MTTTMTRYFPNFLILAVFFFLGGCKQNNVTTQKENENSNNDIRHAKGFSIHKYDGFTLVKVSKPWPGATKDYTYIVKQKSAKIPDSLSMFETITLPVQKIIVTSTTHIPSLEMLNVENTLVGFPNSEYISSEKVRSRIDGGHVRELGSNQNLNTEVVIDLQPDVIVGYGIDNNNATLDNLQKSGLKIMLNGDWNEATPLGKAEWIKFFGVLYGLEEKADSIFSSIEKEYNSTLALVKKTKIKPTVLAGAIYENKWYLPQGESWGSLMIEQAGGNYLWHETKGSGSLSLPFEKVLETAENAEVWIGPGQFTTLSEMVKSNPHYGRFAAFKNKNVYSYSTKKGKTGGIIYFELAPNRPDLVLKDLVKILHPDLLPNYDLYFFEKLK